MSLHIDPANSPTPNRITALTLDVSEKVLRYPGINCRRAGVEIARHTAEGTVNDGDDVLQNIKYWSSGAITLAPTQEDISIVHESPDGPANILDASLWDLLQYTVNGLAETVIKERKNQARLTGTTNPGYTSGINTSGDPFLHRVIPAGADQDPTNAVVAAYNAGLAAVVPQVTLPGVDCPMDRAGKSTEDLSADQGFLLRFSFPGTPHDYKKYCASFYFGQYSLTFTGDGKCLLYEYCHQGETLRWVKRASWRYATAKQVMGTAHTLAIWPHLTPGGAKYIAFANNELETAQLISRVERSRSRDSATGEKLYRADTILRGIDTDEAGEGHVTKANPVHFDFRRDLNPQMQVSKLGWKTEGVLTDLAESLGTSVGNTNDVTLTMAKSTPTGTAITGVVKDAHTGTTFVPGVDAQPYAQITLTGDGTNTPVLYAYRIKQDEVTQTITPGSFALNVTNNTGLSLAMFAGDSSEESGVITTHDLANTHTRLQKRGRFRASLTTTYPDPDGGAPHTVSLAEGYVVRPRRTRVGTGNGNTGFHGAGTDDAYPAPLWSAYALPWQGMYKRLAEKVTPTFGVYVSDPDDGEGRPWKVTDVIKNLLLACGFDSTQIAIPDLGMRLWPGHAGSIEDQIIQPGADIAEACVRMARNYLGAYLYYHPQIKKWTLLFGTQAETDGTYASPVCHFVTDGPAVSTSAPHLLGSYPANTYFTTGPIEFVNIEPNFNSIVVSASVDLGSPSAQARHVAYAYNPLSFDVPGSTVSPDPEHPDYLGYPLELQVIDPSLDCGDPASTWVAVSWLCRRLYDFLCHGQDVAAFRCPLPMIYDAVISAYRPIRFQDPVTLDGSATWLVKSVQLDYFSDLYQSCIVELIQPVAGQYFVGTDGTHFRRQEGQQASHRANGSGDGGKLYGNLALSAAAEHHHKRLPLYNPTQVPLQDNTGLFTPMGGWLVQTGGDG